MAKSIERREHSGERQPSTASQPRRDHRDGEALDAMTSNVVAGSCENVNTIPARLKASTFTHLQRTLGNRVTLTLLPQPARPGAKGSRARGETPSRPGTPISPTTPRAKIQRLIKVATPDYKAPADPVKTWSLTAEEHNLYQQLVTRADTYRFHDEGALVDFVRHYAKWFTTDPVGFWMQASGNNLVQVTSATVGNAAETVSELSYPIVLTLDNSQTIQVNVFASKRRHLAENLTIDKEWPAESKLGNSIVMSPDKFRASLRGYAQDHADAIRARHMLQGYEPAKTKHGSVAAEIAFETDQPELPNVSYGRVNALHSFPSSGKEVYRPDQDSFAKLVVLCSYLYDTNEYKGATRVDPQKRGDRQNLLAGWGISKDKTAQQTLTKATARGKDLVEKIKLLAAKNYTLTADPVVLAKDWAALSGPEKGPILAALNYCVTNLYDVLFSYGAIPESDAVTPINVEVNEAAGAYDAIKTAGGVTWTLLEALVLTYKPKRAYPPVAVGGDEKTRKQKYDLARNESKNRATGGTSEEKIATLQRLLKAAATATPPVVLGVDL
jgi:hypothetical protein